MTSKEKRKNKGKREHPSISPSDTNKTIDDIIRGKEREELVKELNAAGKLIRKIPKESWMQAIRESRDER